MRLSFGYTANAKKKSPRSQPPPILVSSLVFSRFQSAIDSRARRTSSRSRAPRNIAWRTSSRAFPV